MRYLLFMLLFAQSSFAQHIEIIKKQASKSVYTIADNHFDIRIDSAFKDRLVLEVVGGKIHPYYQGGYVVNTDYGVVAGQELVLKAGLREGDTVRWMAQANYPIRRQPCVQVMLDAPVSKDGQQYLSQAKGIKVYASDEQDGYYQEFEVWNYKVFFYAEGEEPFEFENTGAAFEAELLEFIKNSHYQCELFINDIHAKYPWNCVKSACYYAQNLQVHQGKVL